MQEHIDIRGFNIEYRGLRYTAISILERSKRTYIREGLTFKDADYLVIAVINSDGRFLILEDMSYYFTFSKDTKIA